jgi:hypothetical protein
VSTDFAGNDLISYPNTDMSGCMALCNARADCAGFIDISGNTCVLKNSGMVSKGSLGLPNPNIMAGTKGSLPAKSYDTQSNINYSGYDLFAFPVPNNNDGLKQCQKTAATTPGAGTYTYGLVNGIAYCWIKDQTANKTKTTLNGATSGNVS